MQYCNDSIYNRINIISIACGAHRSVCFVCKVCELVFAARSGAVGYCYQRTVVRRCGIYIAHTARYVVLGYDRNAEHSLETLLYKSNRLLAAELYYRFWFPAGGQRER